MLCICLTALSVVFSIWVALAHLLDLCLISIMCVILGLRVFSPHNSFLPLRLCILGFLKKFEFHQVVNNTVRVSGNI